jgi:hypothetical protein
MNANNIHQQLSTGQPEWKLEYIKQFAATQSIRQISEVVLLSERFIIDYCALHNIEKRIVDDNMHVSLSPQFVKQCLNRVRALLRSNGNNVFVAKRIERYEMEHKEKQETKHEKKKLVRPPAQYDNKSREDRINELLKMDV